MPEQTLLIVIMEDAITQPLVLIEYTERKPEKGEERKIWLE